MCTRSSFFHFCTFVLIFISSAIAQNDCSWRPGAKNEYLLLENSIKLNLSNSAKFRVDNGASCGHGSQCRYVTVAINFLLVAKIFRFAICPSTDPEKHFCIGNDGKTKLIKPLDREKLPTHRVVVQVLNGARKFN